MTDNEFLLFDRLEKIKSVINQYGKDNFYISFSGGKDSCTISALVDMALPDNKIPRVYANTGIEYNMIRDFVLDIQKRDERVVIIKPTVPIKPMLEKDGYPFKSKIHSHCVNLYQTDPTKNMWKGYTGQRSEYWHTKTCPKKLMYQFTDDFNIKVSDKCCFRLKEEPLKKWQEENTKPYAILGIMPDEGGRRTNSKCLMFKSKRRMNFQPLVVCTKEWEDWLIKTYNIKICDIYKPPYNFSRTGCKGCPFAIHIQRELDILEKYFPEERKQCEIIWKPVYDEYRRIGYRLKKTMDN